MALPVSRTRMDCSFARWRGTWCTSGRPAMHPSCAAMLKAVHRRWRNCCSTGPWALRTRTCARNACKETGTAVQRSPGILVGCVDRDLVDQDRGVILGGHEIHHAQPRRLFGRHGEAQIAGLAGDKGADGPGDLLTLEIGRAH